MEKIYNNMANGGLVLKFKHKEIISDFNRYWFLNTDDEFIYYSDGTDNHYLYRYNENDPDGTVIMKKPCTNVILYGDWLYYINESDRRVYRCLRTGRSESLFLNEAITEFVMYDKNDIIFTTEKGDLKSFEKTLASGINPSNLCFADGLIFYANGFDNNYLTCMDINNGSDEQGIKMGDIVPTYINSDGRYIYYTDALQENAIFRLGLRGGNPLKICGESAGYLHILDDELYFWNNTVWKKVSLDGGNAREV